ncbi:MAG: FmdB family zinc ribbon protein [Anaerolineaceae bacterium]
MPTYVYLCQECGNRFEALRSMRDSDAPIACKTCRSENTHRCLTACNVNTNSTGSSSISSNTSGCGGCHGGSCSSCGH